MADPPSSVVLVAMGSCSICVLVSLATTSATDVHKCPELTAPLPFHQSSSPFSMNKESLLGNLQTSSIYERPFYIVRLLMSKRTMEATTTTRTLARNMDRPFLSMDIRRRRTEQQKQEAHKQRVIK